MQDQEMGEFLENLKEAAKRNYEPLKASRIFISLFSKDMVKEPLPVLQLGMAILLNKPIAVLAPEGEEVPEALKRLSFCVETFQKENVKSASEKVLKAAKDHGFM